MSEPTYGIFNDGEPFAEVIREIKATMARLSKARGGLDAGAVYHLNKGGHFLRAKLAARTCESLGLRPSVAVSVGAAIEFLHNASLIHDDLQDGDAMRRGQLAVWKEFGPDIAINLGDLFLTLAFSAALEVEAPAENKVRMLQLATGRTADVIKGQSLEIDFRSHACRQLSEYESVARGKTGPLLSLAVEAPLVLSGASRQVVGHANAALSEFGLAYQIRDDISDFIAHSNPVGEASESRLDAMNLIVLLTHSKSIDNSGPVASVPQAIEIAKARFYSTCERCRTAALGLPEGLRGILEDTVTQTSTSFTSELLNRKNSASERDRKFNR